jgi:predicted methyltransferase
MRQRFAPLLLVSMSYLLITPATEAQKKSVNPGINRSYQNPNVQEYIGRFEKEGRDVYNHRHAVVKACRIRPEMTVADIGAGTGLFTRMFSPLVGVKGKVYAVDISEKFVNHIEKSAEKAGLRNVTGVVCGQDSVRLPPGSVDLVFICDTYHHFEFPQKTMQSILQAMKPDGQLILIDYHRIEGVSPEWTLKHLRAGQKVFTQEIENAGFRQIEEKKNVMKHSYFVRFVKAAR